MLFLAELLSWLLPAEVRTRRAHLLHGTVVIAMSVLVLASLGRRFGLPGEAIVQWSAVLAGCVAAGYAAAWPVLRRRRTTDR
ncbi:hypothetical protein ACLIYP_05765 [Streptomyces nanhaiensis]|uniref:hypothetical protein n=1 Tax=Streptomyces nanhaiensis TaxID=679319 RepID=UPI00399CF80A